MVPPSYYFYKLKGALFCDSNWFMPHKTDVATCWPWYNLMKISELNILATSRFHEMFEAWLSISFAWQIPLSRGSRLFMTSSHPFFWVWFLRVGIKTYTNFYVHTTWSCKIVMMRTSISIVHSTDNWFHHMPNWLKFIPQTSSEAHYSPRYLIAQFLLERIMVNVLLHRCCATRIDLKLGRWAAMQPF